MTSPNCDNEELDDFLTDEDQDDSEQENNSDVKSEQENSSDMELEPNKDEDGSTNRKKSPIKLLLGRCPWFIIGLLILVTGVVLGQYHIHLPYHPATAANCSVDVYNDNNTNVDEMNFTNSTIVTPNYYKIL